MDIKNKKTILRQLAKKDEERAIDALKKEARKIALVLGNSTNYQELSDNLELLDIIAYRVYETAVNAVKDFLSREGTIKLIYDQEESYQREYLEKYQNFSRLCVEAIKILEHIRYHAPDRIINLLLEYSKHEKEEVSEQAQKGLIEYAKFHLEIFYANEKGWAGLGAQPQEKLIAKLQAFNNDEKRKYFSVIKALCREMLSSTLEGTGWTYKTVTLSTGAIPVTDDIKALRLNVLKVLKSLYFLAVSPKEKMSVLGTMYESGRTPHQAKYSDDLLTMTVSDSLFVLNFVKEIVAVDELEVVQDIEHDVYWQYRRDKDPKIQSLALEIKNIIDKNAEYQIFKILIGFQGIFSEWLTKEESDDSRDFEKERELRQSKAKEFALSITQKNFPEWKKRILNYAQVDSEDLATFPYFGQFLEAFAKSSPILAIKLVQDEHQHIERFLVAIFSGLWESSEKEKSQEIAESWIQEGTYLYYLARVIGYAKDFDKDFLSKILISAKEKKDLTALIQIVSSVSAHYKESDIDAINNLFIPAIQELTKHGNSNWVHDFWFRQEKPKLFEDMTEQNCLAILENLLLANKISYQHEEVLAELAKHFPEAVIEFFCRRIDKGSDDSYEEKYESVPYSFHTNLVEALSKIPQKAIDIVFKRQSINYAFFMFREAKLLSNIFESFPKGFSKKLIELAHQNTEKTTLFVLGILRNYDGNPRIQDVCKELIKILPNEESLLNETTIALQSTGVVSGEYGFVEAYKIKIDEIKPWLHDENERVREFAKGYIADLEKQIQYETIRAKEGIALRKHQYGDDED